MKGLLKKKIDVKQLSQINGGSNSHKEVTPTSGHCPDTKTVIYDSNCNIKCTKITYDCPSN